MTRPRSQQINDLNTRSSKHQPPAPSVGVSVQNLVNLDLGPNDFYNQFTNATVTKIPGGAEESSSAYLVGFNLEPFIGISVGNQFSITLPGVNGGNPITVTFQAGDFVILSALSVLTASRVAARVNTTLAGFGVSVPVASSADGALQFRSADASGFTVGDLARVQITDITAGVVQKLEFGAVTTAIASGVTGPKRGVITRSADNRGGLVQLRYLNGGNPVLTQTSRALSVGLRKYVPDVPGGSAIYARLINIGGPVIAGETWKLSYSTQENLRPGSTTTQSAFTTLGAGDILRISISYLDVAFGAYVENVDVDFGAGPAVTNVQDVINKINQQWHTTTDGSGTGAGRAVVTSSIPEPYNPQDNLNSGNFYLVLNGNPPIHVVFSGQTSAEDMATVVNNAIAAAAQAGQGSAAAVTISGVNYLEIRSSSIDGTLSSVELRPGDNVVTSDYVTTLERLGLQVGIFHGSVLATLSGGAEIAIMSPFRAGRINLIGFSNQSGTPLAKMGLTAGPFSPTFGEETAALPTSDLNTILIPEMMEFGEVPDDLETTVAKFKTQSNQSPADPLGGIKNFNKFPGVDATGHVSSPFVQKLMDFVTAASIQVGANVGNSTAALIARILAPYRGTPGDLTLMWESISGPAPAIPTNGAFRIYAAGNERWILTYNAKWSSGGGGLWGKDVTTKQAFKCELSPVVGSILSLSQRATGAGTWNDSSWTDVPVALANTSLVGGTPINYALNISNDVALAALSGVLSLSDSNVATASLTQKYIPLSSSTAARGDNHLRVLEAVVTAGLNPSLIRKLNAQWTVTVGDGLVSYGDFTGRDAIQQAITWWQSAPLFDHICIQVKEGSYQVSVAQLAITVPGAGTGIYLRGVHRDAVTIQVVDAISPAIVAQGPSFLYLSDLTLSGFVAGGGSILELDQNSTLVATDVYFNGVEILSVDAGSYFLTRCLHNQASYSKPCLRFSMGDGSNTHGPFVAMDCEFDSATSQPVLSLAAQGAAVPLTLISRIHFERCLVQMRSTTSTASRLTGNCGFVDCDPAGSDATALTGLCVNTLKFKDCEVHANNIGGAISILLHLQPQANGSAVGTGYLGIHRLEIEGGSWTAPPTGTTYSPFMVTDVGGADLVHPGSYGSGKSGVFLSHVQMGFDRAVSGINQGTVTSDSKQWWTGNVADAVAQADWAAFAIHAYHIEINNVQMNNMSQSGTSGDWLFRWAELIIDNLWVNNYVLGGPGTDPTARVRFRPRMAVASSLAVSAKVKGLSMVGATAAVGDWATQGFIVFEPWSDVDPLAVISYDKQVVIDDCAVQLFKIAGGLQSSAAGFRVFTGALSAFYTNSPIHAVDLTVRGSHFSDCLSGIRCVCTVNGATMSMFSYIDNEIRHCTSSGIFHSCLLGGNFDNVAIQGNRITSTGSGGFAGVFVSGDNLLEKTVSITNNHVANNNTSPTGTQIWVDIANTAQSVAFDTPVGVIMGNDCVHQGNVGAIKLNALDGALAVIALVSPSTPGGFTLVRGCETDYSAGGTKQRLFDTTQGMFHNAAKLVTP